MKIVVVAEDEGTDHVILYIYPSKTIKGKTM